MFCRARDLPETALHVASRRPTTQPSTAPFTCAVVWAHEVVRGLVNLRRIDGKDGVAGSIPAGGSTQALTSGNAGEPPSGAVAADHVRIGMGCGRSVRRQSAKSLADQQVWLWSIRYGLNWAGRIAVTEHIAGPRSVSVVAALAAGGGSCRPGCGFWWLLGWIKAVTGDRRSLHGRSPVGSERPGLYTLSGSVRPRRVVRFAVDIGGAAFLADLRSAPPPAAV